MNVLSMNMSINNGDAERRYADFTELVLRDPSELMVFQEVSSDVGRCALRGLTERLGGDYTFHYEKVYPGQEDEQGIAVLTSLPVLSSRATQLSEGGNQAQIVTLGTRDNPIGLANVHLEAPVQKEILRRKKMRELISEMRAQFRIRPQILAGDFNALPRYPTVQMIKGLGYTSAYAAIHGKEPDVTYPTLDSEQLVEGRYLKPKEAEQLQQLARIVYWRKKPRPEILEFTTDYIFLKNMPRPVAARLIIGKNGSSEPISDHAGLRVVI